MCGSGWKIISVSSLNRSVVTVAAVNCIAGDNKSDESNIYIYFFSSILIFMPICWNTQTLMHYYTHVPTHTHTYTHERTHKARSSPCHSPSEACRSVIGELWNGKQIRVNKQINRIKCNFCWFRAHKGEVGEHYALPDDNK